MDAYPRAIERVAPGRADVAPIATDRIDLAAASEMFPSLADSAPGLGEVLIYPERE